MQRTWTIISVADVPQSFKWYQHWNRGVFAPRSWRVPRHHQCAQRGL